MKNDLSQIWDGLTTPTRELTASAHPETQGVWLATDEFRRRHLLVQAPSGSPREVLLKARGLRASFESLTLDGEEVSTWADIVCTEQALNETFLAVAATLIREVRQDPHDMVGAVKRTLQTWRWFWGVDPDGMSASAALGLFGELWFLDRWIAGVAGVERWFGPTGTRHDFVSPAVSVECKATRVRSDGSSAHRITHLDQLDAPESGQLYLFSLQVSPDENAGNSLALLVERLRERFRVRPDALMLLNQRLSEASWTTAESERHWQTYRVVAEELFEVAEGFPRLVRSSFPGGIPDGVDAVTYSLSLAACEPWRRARTPSEARGILEELRR